MSKKYSLFFYIICLLFIVSTFFLIQHFWYAQKNIQYIDSYAQVNNIFAEADSDTLILFDVDQTLIEPASMLFRPKTVENEAYRPWLIDLVSRVYGKSNKPEEYYGSIWRVKEIPLLIEPNIVSIIQSLQDRGVKVVALTALKTGSDYTIPSLPEWRYDQLKKLGIDFGRIGLPDIIFDELSEKNGNYPVLYHGILCTNGVSKGDLVVAFLDRIQWRPSKVVFFDDNEARVKDVERAMQERSIPFQGFVYLGAEYMPGELNKEVAEFQLNYLVEHEDWITEEQALLFMSNNITAYEY